MVSLGSISRRRILGSGLGVAGAYAVLRSTPFGRWARAEAAEGAGDQVSDDPSLTDQQWAELIMGALGGTAGQFVGNGVFEVDLPRTDISATIAGIAVKPDFALETELSFKRVNGTTVMKFEACLLDSEVDGVVRAWGDQDLHPRAELFTALHNHYVKDQPQLRFMHGFANANADNVAARIYNVLSAHSGTPFGHGPEPPGNPGFDAESVTEILGGTGKLSNGVLTVSVSRPETFTQRGFPLPSEMQFEHIIKFQKIGDNQVATLGEVLVLKNEADAVARYFEDQSIRTSALHNHELDVTPFPFYLHALRTGNPESVAIRWKEAISLTNTA